MANAERDENNIPVAMWVSSVDWTTPVPLEVTDAGYLQCET